MFYQRLLASWNEESVAAEIQATVPKPEYEQIIKAPYVLEFLDLPANECFYESSLEQALIDPATLTSILVLRDGDQFCGRVNMQKIDEEVPELGIDILKEYQNQGHGPVAITAFAN